METTSPLRRSGPTTDKLRMIGELKTWNEILSRPSTRLCGLIVTNVGMHTRPHSAHKYKLRIAKRKPRRIFCKQVDLKIALMFHSHNCSALNFEDSIKILLDTHYPRSNTRRHKPIGLFRQNNDLVFSPEMVSKTFCSFKPFKGACTEGIFSALRQNDADLLSHCAA